MEHLVLTGGAKPGPNEDVRYLAKTDYIGIPFLDYPEVTGQAWALFFSNDVPYETATSLAQTWLFFCFFQEILGPKFFRHEDYVCTRLDARGLPGAFLTTEKLISTIEAWRDDTKTREHVDGEYEHIAECILKASHHNLTADTIDCNIAKSIRSAGAVMDGYVRQVYGKSPGAWNGSAKIHPRDLQVMVAQGWCAFEASRVWMSCYSIQSQMLLRTVRRALLPGTSHRGCTTEECQHSTIPDSFVPGHVSTGCNCQMISFGPSDYAEKLILGQICALEVGFESVGVGSKITSIDLIGIDSSYEYTAISHVWADGLGNASANALPRCQVETVARKVQSLLRTAKPGSPPETCVRIWLDVLCCPLKPAHLRSRGIQDLRKTYQDASQVMVLDRQLESLDAESLSRVDLGLQIVSSRWQQRLWTLQEATMASKLWFRFSDQYIEATDFRERLFDLYLAREPTLVGAYFDLVAEFNQLRSHGIFHHGFGHTLLDVAKAVCLRSVSVPSDEALCVGGLLGESLPFVEEFEGQNMAEIWRICVSKSLVQAQAIFHEAPRLSVKSFGWAPRSLLYDNHKLSRGEISYIGNTKGHQVAISHPDGLQVDFKGIIAEPAPNCTSCQKILEAMLDQVLFRWVLIYDGTRCEWFTFKLLADRHETHVPMTSFPSHRIAFIRRPLVRGVAVTSDSLLDEVDVGGALLALVDEEAKDSTCVRAIVPGQFWRHQPAHATIMNRLFLQDTHTTVDEVVEQIESLDPSDYTLRAHRLTKKRRREQPQIVRDYAENLLMRKEQLLVCTSVYNEDRTWVVS